MGKKIYIDDWLAGQLAIEKILHGEARRRIRQLAWASVIMGCLALAALAGCLWVVLHPGIKFIPLYSAGELVPNPPRPAPFCRSSIQVAEPLWGEGQAGCRQEAEQQAGCRPERAG